MLRRTVTFFVALAGLLIGCAGEPTDTSGAPPLPEPHRHREGAPPNIIFLVLDTARADRVSGMLAPSIDGFSRDAVSYTEAHSVAPWTLPSHMSMFTGLLPGEHGATWRAFSEPEDADLRDVMQRTLELSSPERMLPARLRELGYHGAGFSSNAWVARRTGFDHGFADFFEIWLERKRIRDGWDSLDPAVRTSREFDRGDAGQLWVRFREYVRESGGLPEPFFLFFNFIDPHYPYSPPELWRYAWSDDRQFGERIADFEFSEIAMVAGKREFEMQRLAPFYDGEIAYVDFAVGRLLGWLQRMGYYEESLILITSDHGELLGERGGFSHQFSVAEELLRIPLLVKYPGNARAGESFADPRVSNLDVYATLLAAAGVPAEQLRREHSLDLADPATFHRANLLAEYYHAVPFLRTHHEAWEGFSIDDHRVTRRVVFDGRHRHEFVERRGEDPAGQPEGLEAAPGREAAAQLVRDYVRLVGEGLMRESGRALDEETLERLRSLGYVQAR